MKNKVFAALMTAALLAGCGGSSKPAPAADTPAPASAAVTDMSSVKTFGEVLDAVQSENQASQYENMFIYVFTTADGTIYRAVSKNMDPDTYQALWDLSWDDPDFDAKRRELLADVAVDSLENLSEQIPSQEELDAFVGKTGKDLEDAGWTEGYGYNLEDMEFYLDKKPFNFVVTFEKDKEYENTDDFNVWATIEPLTIKSIVYNGLGDASGIE